MCGIAGYLNLDYAENANYSIIKKMTDAIAHRGPDGEGFHIKDNLALGHRRLSIIDIETGAQPMFNEDKSIVIVFNGEIYNYIELRNELLKYGHKFRTNSDTEVIIKAYEQWGTDCNDRFNGMWAFAIWDSRKNWFFISRDRFGEKPLFYTLTNDKFIFCSELSPILQMIPPKTKIDLLELYLFFTYIPEPYTFYENIYKLEAGKYLIVQNDSIRKHTYWDLPEIDESGLSNKGEEVYEKFKELLTDSVKLRMRSDVSFGAFLSGGLDSSTIVSLMSENSNQNVKTFTIGFNDSAFDESSLAQLVADKYNTEHRLGIVEPEEFDTILDKLSSHFGEPFGDSSSIPTFYVSKFAREKVKMALTGDGGDEVLSGYNSYSGIKLYNYLKRIPDLPLNISLNILRMSSNFVGGSMRYKMNKFHSILQTSRHGFNERIIRKLSYAPYDLIKALTKNIKYKISIEEYFSELMDGCLFKEDFYKMMYFDFKSKLPNDYLVKVDRMSMASSLETRIPFLDYRLVEYMYKIKMNIKMPGLDRKHILKKAFGSKLPHKLLKAPKTGFGVPVREWFKEKEFEVHLNSLDLLNDTLNGKVVQKIIKDNEVGKADYGNFIWSLLILTKSM